VIGRKPLHKYDNKYSRGVVGIVAGSKKYPGAALLTVGGARRGGAGYVTFLNTHQSITDLVISHFPDVVPITSITDSKLDALVVGPGATTIRKIPQRISIVLDGGALALARQRKSPAFDINQIVVVTPHEGELKALGYSLDYEVNQSKRKNVRLEKFHEEKRIEVAQAIADELRVICVLKGHRTIIAAPSNIHSNASDGRTRVIDNKGGPELATAGSGDILAGLIGAFLASWKPANYHNALEVVSGAVNLHSLAGIHAAERSQSVVATDILESLAHC
jgi:hydroxyethylthiazole kinase-like uncharacterized protein yjeF